MWHMLSTNARPYTHIHVGHNLFITHTIAGPQGNLKYDLYEGTGLK